MRLDQLKLTRVQAPVLTEAKRRLDQEMPTAKAIELLKRKMAHFENLPGESSNGVRRVTGGAYGDMIRRIPDMRTMTDAERQPFFESWEGRNSPIIRKFYNNPNDFYVYVTEEKTDLNESGVVNGQPSRVIHPAGLDYIYIGDKAEMHSKKLDEDDFNEYCESTEYRRYADQQNRRLKGTHDRLMKRHNEEQAAAMHSAATQQAGAGIAPIPPRTIDISPRNRGLSNPYFQGQQQYNGPLAQCKFAKNGTKSMMNVFAVALAQMGHPIINIQHAVNKNGDDAFYASSANGLIKFYVMGPSSSEMLMGVNGKGYRMKRAYTANNIPATVKQLAWYFQQAGVPLPPGVMEIFL